MGYQCLLFFFFFTVHGLTAQRTVKFPAVDSSDLLVEQASKGILLNLLIAPMEEPVFWDRAGEAAFAVILDLDEEGKIVAVESIAFTGVKSFLPTSVVAFNRFIGGCFRAVEGHSIRRQYVLPVVVSRQRGRQRYYAVDFIELLAALTAGPETGLLRPLHLSSRPPIVCHFGQKKVYPPWVEPLVEKPVGRTLTAKDILQLPKKNIRN